jgi:hypothetical protein
MKKISTVVSLLLLVACQSTPRPEDDTRYLQFARVLDVHVYSDAERKEAAKTAPRSNSGSVGVGVGIGFGTGGGFGGVMLGAGTGLGGGRSSSRAPQIADGANRFTVQPLHSNERIEVMSYGKFQVGDCVKLFSGHPTEYARLFDLKSGERCQ